MCLLYEIELENLTEDECFGDECGFEDFFLRFFPNLLELLERPADEESFIPLRVFFIIFLSWLHLEIFLIVFSLC